MRYLKTFKDKDYVIKKESLVVITFVVAAIILTIMGVVYSDVLGFTDKTLWDWIEVGFIPVVVVTIAGVFGLMARKAEQRNEEQREIDTDRAREITLRTYLEVMSNLILVKNLTTSEKDSSERAVAHAHTFMALRNLDGPRKSVLLQFLKESRLIDRDKNIISLNLADLDRANLSNVDLSGTCLSGATLKDADLYSANLSNADLSYSVLVRAELLEADLSNTNLRNADLTDALVEREQLDKASDISGALLPQGIDEDPEVKGT